MPNETAYRMLEQSRLRKSTSQAGYEKCKKLNQSVNWQVPHTFTWELRTTNFYLFFVFTKHLRCIRKPVLYESYETYHMHSNISRTTRESFQQFQSKRLPKRGPKLCANSSRETQYEHDIPVKECDREYVNTECKIERTKLNTCTCTWNQTSARCSNKFQLESNFLLDQKAGNNKKYSYGFSAFLRAWLHSHFNT